MQTVNTYAIVYMFDICNIHNTSNVYNMYYICMIACIHIQLVFIIHGSFLL